MVGDARADEVGVARLSSLGGGGGGVASRRVASMVSSLASTASRHRDASAASSSAAVSTRASRQVSYARADSDSRARARSSSARSASASSRAEDASASAADTRDLRLGQHVREETLVSATRTRTTPSSALARFDITTIATGGFARRAASPGLKKDHDRRLEEQNQGWTRSQYD